MILLYIFHVNFKSPGFKWTWEQEIPPNNPSFKAAFTPGVVSIFHVLSCVWTYMRVSHTAGRYESLLQGFILQAEVHLLTLAAPGEFQQTLDDLRMTPESRMN